MTNFLQNISALFRECEQMFASRDFCFLAMESIKKAILDFRGSNQELFSEMEKMVEIVKSTTPRIALLMMMVFQVFEVLEERRKKFPDESISDLQNFLSETIDTVVEKRKKSVQKLLQFSEEVLLDGDHILLQNASHTVFDMLLLAQKEGKQIYVTVAKQEEEKTANIIRFLSDHHFSFQVIPEYLLSYVRENVDKVFIGCVTINSLHEIISDAGTNSLVSQMHEWEIPVFIPITTDKFSLWHAENKHHSHKIIKKKSISGIEYNKLIFSHDRFPISLVTKFITNKGILTSSELKDLYDKYQQGSVFWREKNKIS